MDTSGGFRALNSGGIDALDGSASSGREGKVQIERFERSEIDFRWWSVCRHFWIFICGMSRLTDSTTRLDGAGFKVDSWIVVDDDEGDDDDDDDGGSDGGCDDDDDDPKV